MTHSPNFFHRRESPHPAGSCYSMTEPHGGSDPTEFKCRATEDGDFWVINGEKIWPDLLLE